MDFEFQVIKKAVGGYLAVCEAEDLSMAAANIGELNDKIISGLEGKLADGIELDPSRVKLIVYQE